MQFIYMAEASGFLADFSVKECVVELANNKIRISYGHDLILLFEVVPVWLAR